MLLPAFLLFHPFVSTFFIFRVFCLGSHLYPLPCDVISSALPHPHGPLLLFSAGPLAIHLHPLGSHHGPLLSALRPHGPDSLQMFSEPSRLFTHCSLCLECSSPAPPSGPAYCYLPKAARPGLLLWKGSVPSMMALRTNYLLSH